MIGDPSTEINIHVLLFRVIGSMRGIIFPASLQQTLERKQSDMHWAFIFRRYVAYF